MVILANLQKFSTECSKEIKPLNWETWKLNHYIFFHFKDPFTAFGRFGQHKYLSKPCFTFQITLLKPSLKTDANNKKEMFQFLKITHVDIH